ncbi:MAG: GTP 3',8-cyclase MoaA [Opitutales bacterium]
MQPPKDQLGRPLHDLRISLTDRCNFRCTYCMPSEVFGPDYPFLEAAALLTFDEIERLARAFARLGVEKLRLTGGEPLLRRNITELIGRLSAIPGIEDIALTTNGVLLPRYAGALRSAGLQRINVSLDAIDPTVFATISGGRGKVDKVLAGIDAAAAAGFEVKVNMVVEAGVNTDQILPMARHFRGTPHILRFIEFMDVGNHNGWSLDQVYPARQILEDLQTAFRLEPMDPNYRGEVANRYRFTDTGGEIGIISSISQPFCRDCTRARLSADGRLFTCLFADQGRDLRPLLRGPDALDEPALTQQLARHWQARSDRYSEQRADLLARHASPHKVEMSYIGG